MSDVKLQRNASNGRQGLSWGAGGDVVFDDTEQHAVMASLVAARGRWWADGNGRLGSQLRLIQHISASTKSDAEAYVREALADLVSSGRISLRKVVIDTPAKGMAGRVDVAVYWSSRGGPEQMTRVFF